MTQHRDDQLVQILDQCCELIAAGESSAACLARFPEHAAVLEPLLTTVAGVRESRAVPARQEALALERRARFMTAAFETSRVVKNRPVGLWAALVLWWRQTVSGFGALFGPYGSRRALPVGLVATLAVIFLLGTLTTGAVTTSARAIPGDPLYPVKTIAEHARIILARDQRTRHALENRLADEQLHGIRSVVTLQRRVDQMPFTGVTEEIGPNEWKVSGLRILIVPETVIQGVPWVGGAVSGAVRAPGDGALVALRLAVEPGPAPVPVSSPTSSPTGRPTSTPTVTPTPVPTTPRPTLTPTASTKPIAIEPDLKLRPTEPPDTATPTARPRATRTRTRVLTPTPTPTLGPTATWTPWPTAPRAEVKRRIIDWVRRVDGSRWTLGEITAETDSDTVFVGSPDTGSLVEAELLVRPNGSYLALLIQELADAAATPQPLNVTGEVKSIASDQWTVGSTVIRIDRNTEIDDGIQVGDWVTVDAERRSGGETWAKAIRKLAPAYQFSGVVESIHDDTWTVAGNTFRVTGQTKITGDPTVGDYVDVEVVELPDGSLEATLISRVVDTANPSVTIDTSPANPTNVTSAAFTFTGDDLGGTAIVRTQCDLDGGGFVDCDSASSQGYAGPLADGSHTFTVKVTDRAGNSGTGDYTWVVDTANPSVAIDTSPANPTNVTSAAFTFTGDDLGGTAIVSTQCDLDGGGFVDCNSASAQSYDGPLSDGSHTFTVEVTDGAGNSSTDDYTWVVDTANPAVAI
jgi:hypothetical protein